MAIDYNLLKLTPPEPTVKVMTAQDYLSGSQAIRDARRKKAIEFAMRSGIDAKGELNTEAMRQSLISQGFGENADQVVREVSMARLGDAATTAKTGADIAAAVEMGLIDPKMAANLFGKQIIETEIDPSQTQSQIFRGVPGAKLPGEAGYIAPTQSTQPDVDADGNIIIRASGNGSTTVSQMTPPQEPRQFTARERGAQAVPDYISGFVKFGEKSQAEATTPSQAQASFTWKLPENKKDQERILEVAQNLGFSGATSGLESWIYDTADALVDRKKYVPKKPGAEGYYEARAEQTLADSTRPSEVATKARNLAEYLYTGRNTDISQDIEREKLGFQRAAEARAREKDEREKDQTLTSRNKQLSSDATVEQAATAAFLNGKFLTGLEQADRIIRSIERGERVSPSDVLDFSKTVSVVADENPTIDGMRSALSLLYKGPLPKEVSSELAKINKFESQSHWDDFLANSAEFLYKSGKITRETIVQSLRDIATKVRSKKGLGPDITDTDLYKKYLPKTAGDALRGGAKPKDAKPAGAAPASGPKVGDKRDDGKVWTGKAWR